MIFLVIIIVMYVFMGVMCIWLFKFGLDFRGGIFVILIVKIEDGKVLLVMSFE